MAMNAWLRIESTTIQDEFSQFPDVSGGDGRRCRSDENVSNVEGKCRHWITVRYQFGRNLQ